MVSDPIRDIIDFWFGPATDDGTVPAEHQKTWWQKSDAHDARIRERFGELFAGACRGELAEWEQNPRGTLALILLLDQFSRNLHRDDPRAWAQDPQAQRLALALLDSGGLTELPAMHQAFALMPLVHSEDRALHARCIEAYTALHDRAPAAVRESIAGFVRSAEHHRSIVDRFGRYPHRNAVLGRASTDEEAAFLEQPGSSF